MCYDERNEVCVLYGGSDRERNSSGRTWLWNGETWSQAEHYSVTPSAGHAMVWTPRGATMWGGQLGIPRRFYMYNGENSWQSNPGNPGLGSIPRTGLAYDAKRDTLVMTGDFGIGGDNYRTMFVECQIEAGYDIWRRVEVHDLPQFRKAYHPIVYDPEREQIVYIGAIDYEARRTDAIETWTWDGTNWNGFWTTCGNPRFLEACRHLVYDPDRKCVVAVCDAYDALEVHELRDDAWVKRDVNPIRYPTGCCVAYDRKRKQLVVHGGRAPTGYNKVNTTWVLGDGDKWELKHGAESPATHGHWGAVAYDPQAKETLLIAQHPTFSDSHPEQKPDYRLGWLREWTWNGKEWHPHELPPELRKPRRKVMVWDSARSQMLLLLRATKDLPSELWERTNGSWTLNPDFPGEQADSLVYYYDEAIGRLCWLADSRGVTEGQVILDRLSVWDGRSVVSRVIPDPAPTLMLPTTATYDRDRKQLVLLGRNAVSLKPETWEFDGTSWSNRRPANSPPAHGAEAFCYLGAIKRCVLFGGGKKPQKGRYWFHDDHWEWDGTDWHLIRTATQPSARMDALIAEDREAGCLVLFGGSDGLSYALDTWEYGFDR